MRWMVRWMMRIQYNTKKYKFIILQNHLFFFASTFLSFFGKIKYSNDVMPRSRGAVEHIWKVDHPVSTKIHMGSSYWFFLSLFVSPLFFYGAHTSILPFPITRTIPFLIRSHPHPPTLSPPSHLSLNPCPQNPYCPIVSSAVSFLWVLFYFPLLLSLFSFFILSSSLFVKYTSQRNPPPPFQSNGSNDLLSYTAFYFYHPQM